MKTLGLLIVGLFAGSLVAQTKIDRNLPVQGVQKIKMRFDYPELIRVSTWDKSEVSIQCRVSINDGENDDAFKLETSVAGNTLSIRNEIKDMEDLPHRITVTRDGQKMVFRNEAEWKKYQEEHGNARTNILNGVDMDIQLEIKVPGTWRQLLNRFTAWSR